MDADSNGFIGSFHKNTKANLASICEKCHHKLHHPELDKSKSSKKETVKMVRKKTTKGSILDTI